MAEDQKDVHRLELRVQSLETRIKYGLFAIAAIAAAFGITGIVSIFEVRETLDARIEEVANGDIAAHLQGLKAQADKDAQSIRASLKESCHDPRWLDATGMCIFHLRPPGGGYAMNYGGAAALCAAHGARLCTLDQVRAAHAKGAEWCAATWVADLGEGVRSTGDPTYERAGVLAFPTQGKRKGCGEGVNVFRDQNILTQNADAACCM